MPPGLSARRVSSRLAQAAILLALGYLLAISRTRAWQRSHPVLGAPDLRVAGAASVLAVILGLSRARRWRLTQRPMRRARVLVVTQVNAALDRADDILGAAEAALRSGSARLRQSVGALVPSVQGGAAPAVWSGSSEPALAAFRSEVPAHPGLRARTAGRPGFIARNLPVAAAIALAAGVATAALPSLLKQQPAPSPVRDPQAVAAVPAPALASVSAVTPAAPTKKPEAGQVGGGREAPAGTEPYQIAWPYDIADGLTFGPEGAVKTRLAGLEGPARDSVCNDRYNQPWACGLQARAALNNVTRRQNLTCEPTGLPRAGGTAIPARCKGDTDLARELVLSGFARPLNRDPALESAEDDARKNERGLWNGGWTIRMSAR